MATEAELMVEFRHPMEHIRLRANTGLSSA